MKLNPICIRDILLLIENSTDGIDPAYFYDQSNKPKEWDNYTYAEVIYHAMQCSKHGFVEGFSVNDDRTSFFVTDISPAGHAFLANIRNDKLFEKTLSICKEIGVSSLKDIAHIASLSALALIKGYFGIP